MMLMMRKQMSSVFFPSSNLSLTHIIYPARHGNDYLGVSCLHMTQLLSVSAAEAAELLHSYLQMLH